MRTILLSVFLLWSACFTAAAQPDPLRKLAAEVEAKQAEIATPLRDFNAKYEAQLQKLEEKAMTSGELNRVIAVREERAKYAEGGTEAPEGFADLKRLQAIYRKEADRLTRSAAARRLALLRSHHRKLLQLKVTLTRESRIEDAVAAKAEAEKVAQELASLAAADAEIAEAPGSEAGSTAAANPESPAALPAYLSKYPKIEGFSKVVRSASSGSYRTYRSTSHPSYWAYARDSSQAIEWLSGEVPRRYFSAPKITLVWGGANGEVSSTWDLFLNGTRVLTAETNIAESKTWEEDGFSLHFAYSHRRLGHQGVYYLTVPRSALHLDREQRLKWVEKNASSASMDWIMVNGFTDMTGQE